MKASTAPSQQTAVAGQSTGGAGSSGSAAASGTVTFATLPVLPHPSSEGLWSEFLRAEGNAWDNTISVAKLEAHAAKWESSDDVARALPLIFLATDPARLDVGVQPAAETQGFSRPGTASVASKRQLLFGVAMLRDVYEEACQEYLDKSGVLDVLDHLVTVDASHPDQAFATWSGTSAQWSTTDDGSAVSNASLTAFDGPSPPRAGSPRRLALPSIASSAQSKATSGNIMRPTLPLIRAIEAWRLQHPRQKQPQDAPYARARNAWREVYSTLRSSDLTLQLERITVLRRVGTTGQLSSSTFGTERVLPAASQCYPSGHFEQDADGADDMESAWTCCGYQVDLSVEQQTEPLLATIGRIELRAMELRDTLESIHASESILVQFPWAKSLVIHPSEHFRVPPEALRFAAAALGRWVAMVKSFHEVLLLLMDPAQPWTQCLNENLQFLKRPSSCGALPQKIDTLREHLKVLLDNATSPVISNHFPEIRWVLLDSRASRDANWVLQAWTGGVSHLKYLQRLLIAQVETFTIVMVAGEDGQQAPMRQITTTPTTRYDRIYSERRSVVAWGALCFRTMFSSWETLREAPLHRIAQQLKKLHIDKKTTFEVICVLLGSQLDLGPGPVGSESLDPLFEDPMDPVGGPYVIPLCDIANWGRGGTLRDFLIEEETIFMHLSRNLKFTGTTTVRK